MLYTTQKQHNAPEPLEKNTVLYSTVLQSKMAAVSPVEIRHTPTLHVHQLAAVDMARPPVTVLTVVTIRHVQDVVTSDRQHPDSAPRQ